jgi:hypothetical protein
VYEVGLENRDQGQKSESASSHAGIRRDVLVASNVAVRTRPLDAFPSDKYSAVRARVE